MPVRRRPRNSRDDVVAEAARYMSGWVCLGEIAARDIRAGRLDPITAYWNTVFHAPPGDSTDDDLISFVYYTRSRGDSLSA